MDHTPCSSWRLRAGSEPVPAPVCRFERDLCGDAGEPGGYGLDRQAHDGQPAWLGAKDLVAAAGRESVTGRGIESGCIRTFADGGRGNDFTGVGIHDGHHFFVADGKEAATGDVHGEAGRRFARRERPVVEFLEALRVEMIEVGGVFVVYIDRALVISGGEFGLAIERNRADDSAVRGVDGGSIFATPVESEDTLG